MAGQPSAGRYYRVGQQHRSPHPVCQPRIATPASASLQLLGVASDESTLNVWATIPDKNLKQPSWTQYIQWGSLGSGLVPANGVWVHAQIEAAVAAYPDPALKVGAGDTITLTLTYSNTGTASLPQLTLDGVEGRFCREQWATNGDEHSAWG